jgi:tRNA(adenine34) deaminase
MIRIMNDIDFMNAALLEAKKAFKEGEIPVGAVIVKDGKIISKAHNEREKKHDVSSHAEIEAIRLAGEKLGNWRLDGCAIYVTLEPCLMCAGAISQARIERLVYALDDPKEGAISSRQFIFADPSVSYRPMVNKGLLKEESSLLLSKFFFNRRNKI